MTSPAPARSEPEPQAPARIASGGGAAPRRPRGQRLAALRSPATIATAPLLTLIALFFLLPIGGMAIIAFTVEGADGTGGFGFDHFTGLSSKSRALLNSFLVSAVGASIAAVIGAITAWCIAQIRSKRLDSIVAVMSSVLANDGGAPLAFSFIVTLGNTGIVYGALNLQATGFTLYSWQGLVVMYQYFLIPTMIMVTLPTFVGLRAEWSEANRALGGNAVTYWRRVGLPIAMPALLSGWILLFGAAFATYASAAILLGSGAFPLVPLSIASELRSSAGPSEGAAMALGVTMVVIAVVVLLIFNRLQRLSARWTR